MKKTLKIKAVCILAVLLLAVSCSSSDDEPGKNVPSDLVGTWVIQLTSRISKSYSFSDNGTGTYTFIGNTTYYSFPYTYTVSGKNIKIKGTYVNDEGDVDPNWHREGTFSGGILTIDGETLTKR